MYTKLKIVKVDSKYCDYLRKFDSRVPYNAGKKELRPFIGVLFTIGSVEYFAPLSSPKPKHKLLKNTLDLIKISNGEYGVVNINNMIPVTKNNYIEFDLNAKVDSNKERLFLELLRNQIRWLNSNRKTIMTKAKRLYQLYKNNELPVNVCNRCCNFIELEYASLKYENK